MMPRHSNVTDELLSAYLDNAVTTSERALVEMAVADDPEIAWRLATLQHTVSLLGKLPEISLPRAFALTEAMVAEPASEAAGVPIPASIPRPQPVHEPEKTGFWQAWRSFWQGGNVLMRNAAAASFAAFLVLAFVGGTFSQQGVSQISSLALLSDIAMDDIAVEEAQQVQSAESMRIQPAESAASAPAAADMMARDLSPNEAPAAMAVESAPAEPVPLPAESADEAQGAMARTAEIEASSAVERAAEASALSEDVAMADADGVDEVLSAASAPIAVASVTMADESVPEEESSPADNDAASSVAPMAMAVADEPAADADAVDVQRAEDNLQTDAVEADTVAAMADVDTLAVTEAETAGRVAHDGAEDDPSAEHVEVAPVEKAEMTAPAPSMPAEAPMTTSVSTMSNLESDPLRFVQLIALGLTLLFAALWLLSRRTNSPAQ